MIQVRPGTIDDIDFILRMQQACKYEVDTLPPSEIERGLREGLLYSILLFRDGEPSVGVILQAEDRKGLICCLYREGKATDFLEDKRIIWPFILAWFACMDVKYICAMVSLHNPKYRSLMRFYERLGLQIDMIRMGWEASHG